ncbi:hypothetical protein E4U60_005004 [Claviceps pazoutovae]|uniref:Uncharacterized protein n=1 Tax=Claviceps pazoutovae TaxID=1649127 RepID=A0A9P7M8D3_9HYPO|nr:hypothetical protein E4U60_005004 [Claviceps pazoutovae]
MARGQLLSLCPGLYSGKAASEEIWQVGQLVDNVTQTYGMTMFAATLNEIHDIEKGKMAPNGLSTTTRSALYGAGRFRCSREVEAQP